MAPRRSSFIQLAAAERGKVWGVGGETREVGEEVGGAPATHTRIGQDVKREKKKRVDDLRVSDDGCRAADRSRDVVSGCNLLR